MDLIAGLGIFLTACGIMSSGLQKSSKAKLTSLLAATGKSKLALFGVGAAATAVIQSSGATSVIVIGFVGSGIMTLTQAAAVMFGANVGTTVTGLFVATGLIGGNGITASAVLATLTGIGAGITAFAKSDKTRTLGNILTGFGMMFVGLSIMSGAFACFSELDGLKNFLSTFKNPLLLVIVGAVLTAVVQSSSVMTTLAITMIVSGLITLEQGIYITVGADIGTCTTALIASAATDKNAKRAAFIHMYFNIIGAATALVLGMILHLCGSDYTGALEKLIPHTPELRLAVFHVFYNLLTALAVLPFTDKLVKAATKTVR